MRFDVETGTIYMSADELASLAFERENPTGLMQKYGFIVDDPNRPPVSFGTMRSAVPLTKEIALGEYVLVIEACADIISFDGILHTVEQIRNVNYFPRNITPFWDTANFAKSIICTYLFAEAQGIPEIKTKLTFIKESTAEKIVFLAKFTQVFLARMFEALLNRAHVFIKYFADKSAYFPVEADEMPFPYHNIRDGQSEFIKSAYRAIKRGESLMVSAPTGIGKTMSSIFPAVKAIGAGIADKAFYITAKNVTGRAAVDACERLAKYAPHLKAINITSKDQVCPIHKGEHKLGGRINCRHCSLTDRVTDNFGKSFISYREREISALAELLTSDVNVYTTELILRVAERYSVCPYELSLDLSEYCMVVICDYNYVIDDNIRFMRYFKNVSNKEKYIFLFDEAHNIPDRTRNTYSAVISSSVIDELTQLSEKEFASDSAFCEAVKYFNSSISAVRDLCSENEYFRSTDDGEIRYGFYENTDIPNDLITSVGALSSLLSKYIRNEIDNFECLEDSYYALAKVAFVAAFFDKKFRFFATRENEKLTVELLCIDPSGILEKMLQPARSSIMFSATLSPIEYYREVVGLNNAEILELKSPYEQNNLCLVAYDSISTKLTYRRDTAHECAEVIVETISQREGNYIVYFPSYDYMKRVCKVFARLMPGYPIVMQRQGMSYRERERFINLFNDRSRDGVIGFCVLGGMFSEGIDLSGDSLIGAIVVGTGMPSLSAERNIMEAYYNEDNGRGHEFAYVCPGINKVMQAAGRVIRSENDKGIVVLMDDRYSEPGMKMLLPPHWRHIKYTGDLTSLGVILSDFWDKQNK